MANRDSLIETLVERMEELRRNVYSHKPHDIASIKMPTPSQMRVLFLISEKGGMSVKDIAETLQITGSAATQLIDALVADEFVTREEDTDDRRRTVINISERSKNQMKLLRECHVMQFKELTRFVTDDELSMFIEVIVKMINASKAQKSDAS